MPAWLAWTESSLLLFEGSLVRNSELFPALFSAGRQYPATVCRCHSFAETVLVFALSLRRLICTFHAINGLPHRLRAAKIVRKYGLPNLRNDLFVKGRSCDPIKFLIQLWIYFVNGRIHLTGHRLKLQVHWSLLWLMVCGNSTSSITSLCWLDYL